MALLGTAGRWGAPSPAASPAKASGPTEGQVKGKYLAMTLMQVRGECTKLGTRPNPNDHLRALRKAVSKRPGICWRMFHKRLRKDVLDPVGG